MMLWPTSKLSTFASLNVLQPSSLWPNNPSEPSLSEPFKTPFYLLSLPPPCTHPSPWPTMSHLPPNLSFAARGSSPAFFFLFWKLEVRSIVVHPSLATQTPPLASTPPIHLEPLTIQPLHWCIRPTHGPLRWFPDPALLFDSPSSPLSSIKWK